MITSIPFRSTSRARARCLAVLAAMVVTLIGSVAWAMPAPMCDESAQSIAAPFPLLPWHNGELRGKAPCSERGKLELGSAPAPDHELTPPPQLVERVPAMQHRAVPRAPRQTLRMTGSVREAPRPGFADGVFRPPRGSR